MDMIDSKSLFYTAHHLLKQTQQMGNPENWLVKSEPIQDFIIEDHKFMLMVIVKPLDLNEKIKSSQIVDQENLINAAQELISTDPKPSGYDFFKKDVQQFSDLNGNKFILGLTFSLSENLNLNTTNL
jgi:hypothetical protein